MAVALIGSVILVLSSIVLATAQRNSVCLPLNGDDSTARSGSAGDDEIEIEISHSHLQNCEDSKVIDVSHERVMNIQNGTFQGLTKLVKLYLNDNHLELLKSQIFCGAPNITEVDLKGNRLYGIRARTFECVPKLEILLLDRNSIEYFSGGLFANLSKLKILKLNVNKLTDRSFPPEIFKHLISLTSLDLSDNLLTVISETLFQGLNNLGKLYLSGNRLTSLNMLSWPNSLKTIGLGNNPQLDSITMRPDQLKVRDLNDLSTLYYQCNCTESSLYFILVKNKGQPPTCEAQCESPQTEDEYSSQETHKHVCSSCMSYNGWHFSRVFFTAFVAFVVCKLNHDMHG